MYVRTAAALSEPWRVLWTSPVKDGAPVPAATHHTIKGRIQMKVSSLWIHLIPRAQTIQTNVHMRMTPAQMGHFPSDRALSTDAPEIELIAFQPVVAIIENITTSMFPQYPNEYRLVRLVSQGRNMGFSQICTYENVVIRRPVKPTVAVHAGRRSLVRLTTRMTMKQSQNPRPRDPPRDPMLRVAMAMLALSLYLYQ